MTAENENSQYLNTFANTETSALTYAEILGLNADDYAEISTERDLYILFGVSLSVRSVNVLVKSDCHTLDKLLLLTPQQLRKLRNLGQKSVSEIETALIDISRKAINTVMENQFKKGSLVSKSILRPVVEAMLSGLSYSLDNLTESEMTYFAKSVEAAETLGREFCLKLLCGGENEYINCIIDTLQTFSSKVSLKQDIIYNAKTAMAHWNSEVYSKRLFPFVRLYQATRKKPVSDVLKAFMISNAQVSDYIKLIREQLDATECSLKTLAKELKMFQAWMTEANPVALCKGMFNGNNCKDKRAYDVLYARIDGKTLEEIGALYGVTRERIRQREKKALTIIEHRLSGNTHDILGIISAYHNGASILCKDEITETVGYEYSNLLWYCVTRSFDKGKTYLLDTKNAHYDSSHNMVVVLGLEDTASADINNYHKIVEEFIEEMPNLIETNVLNAKLEAYALENRLPKKLFILEAAKQYKKSGIYSHRGRLTVVQMCACILKRRFQNGYKIADKTDAEQFAKYLKEFFGENRQITPRAVDAKIMDIGILIDRGKYIHKDYIHVNKAVADKVFAYIEDSPKTAIYYSEIFAALKDVFKDAGITNRYILQGVMKLYDCPYTSYRDYISKQQGVNIADELNSFMETIGTAHKSDIFAEFPGLVDYNLALVLPRCPKVISLGNGYYKHSSKLSVSEDERYRIKKYLDANIFDTPVSAGYLQNKFMDIFPDFMIRNEIYSQGELFGVLQYMFDGNYNFSRPYIAKVNSGKITNKSVLLKHLEDVDTIEVEDFVDICRQNAVHYVSVSYLIDMMQPEFVRVDADTLMRPKSIGLEEDKLEEIWDIIDEAVTAHNGYLAAGNVMDFSWYPQLEVPWTPFLLESAASMVPCGINIIKTLSTSFETPHSIFVCDDYADDDWNSLLVKLLKAEHAAEPFADKEEVFKWLRAEGLCNVKYPSFLDSENHVYADENGKLRIE